MTTYNWHQTVFDGLHPTWHPTMGILAPFTSMPLRVSSFYEPRASTAEVMISNELVDIRDDGTLFHWSLWGQSGTARFFMGTPRIDSPRALHLPYFYWPWPSLLKTPRSMAPKRPGVSFLVSNVASGGLTKRRLQLAIALSRHYPVHTSAALRSHFPADAQVSFYEVGRASGAKQSFIEQFEFNLCLENERAEGYLTEKPVEALMAGTMPIYEGDPGVGAWLSPESYIDCTGLDADSLLDRIRSAEREGAPAHVAQHRERLVAVSYEAMMARVWNFAGRVRDDLAESEPDWHDPARVGRLRHASATPEERRAYARNQAARRLVRPIEAFLPQRLVDVVTRGLRVIKRRG